MKSRIRRWRWSTVLGDLACVLASLSVFSLCTALSYGPVDFGHTVHAAALLCEGLFAFSGTTADYVVGSWMLLPTIFLSARVAREHSKLPRVACGAHRGFHVLGRYRLVLLHRFAGLTTHRFRRTMKCARLGTDEHAVEARPVNALSSLG